MKVKLFRNINIGQLMIFLLIFGWAGTTNVFAATLSEALRKFLNGDIGDFTNIVELDTFKVMPTKTVNVKGDASKYRVFNWTKDGSQSGIKELKLNAKPGKDTHIFFEGSGMFGDSNYTGDMMLTTDDVGYVKLEYKSFRKYFESRGGKFIPFTSAGMSLHTLPQDLELDIGHFAVEVGKGSAKDSILSLGYEHNTKEGSKSTLNWAYAKDAAFGTATANQRKITPSFYDIDNITDTVKLKGKTDVAGFTVKGEQKYSFFDGKSLNQEQLYSSATTASENKITQQIEFPQTKGLSTTVRAERWTAKDKTFMSFGYRFGQLRNSVIETERDYTSAGNFTRAGFLSGGRFRNGHAQNIQDTHTWTGQVLSNLTNDLIFISRVKGELRRIHSESVYDTLNTSEVVTTTVEQSNESDVLHLGESFSLRYNGLPKTSLYSDIELEQERTSKDLRAMPTTYSEQINRAPEGSGTFGMRFTPFNKVSLTTEFKHGEKNDKLTQDKGSTQAYINKLRTTSDSLSSRLSWKPVKWLENSLRVKTSSHVYHIQVLSLDTSKMSTTERDFTYNVAIMPTDEWMIDASYSRKLSNTGTVGAQYSYSPPAFTGNVDVFALSTSYAPTEKFSVFNTLEYARAKNQTNANSDTLKSTSVGPLLWGVNEEWFNMETGITWSLRKDLTIEPHYAYQSFRSFEGMESGNYSAHVGWLDITLNW